MLIFSSVYACARCSRVVCLASRSFIPRIRSVVPYILLAHFVIVQCSITFAARKQPLLSCAESLPCLLLLFYVLRGCLEGILHAKSSPCEQDDSQHPADRSSMARVLHSGAINDHSGWDAVRVNVAIVFPFCFLPCPHLINCRFCCFLSDILACVLYVRVYYVQFAICDRVMITCSIAWC